ncbi:MAG: enoyl-CoA hydratase/isomerase family protein [Acidobacteria bacterium]|nr:enoyl-CoA hydratase/isomerase family protein [Acidobacteriota bacterium]
MSDEVVLYEVDDGIAIVTLNRPDKLNAFTVELQRLYFERLGAADADPEVRVIVVTGAGRGFCSGADLELLQSIATPDAGGLIAEGMPLPTFPLTLRKPFIAAVNGAAIGAGLGYAVQADIRFVSETAKLGCAFSQRGLVAEYGMSWLLPRICGYSQALDLLLSSRIVSGDEVLRLGLADRLLPGEQVLPEAIAYARDLATNCSPASMSVIKRMVRDHWNLSFDEMEADTLRLMRQSFLGPDLQEGVQSFVEQRPARFPALGDGTIFS